MRIHTPVTCGQPGDDRIEGWSGSDELYGDAGDDMITGGANCPDPQSTDLADEIYGGGGNDRIDGYLGNDEIWGDYHPDDPLHVPNPNNPPAGAGNDEIYGWTGNDTIHGGPGHDNLFGEGGADTIYGGDFKGGQQIIYPGDDDWIFHELYAWQNPPVIPGQEIDLVTNIADDRFVYGRPADIEPYPGSPDNRLENGFYGGRHIWVSNPEEPLAEMQIHVNDPFSNDPQKRLTGKDMILDWEGDGEVIKVYIYDKESEEYTRITPDEAIWTITDPWEPISIYVEALDREGTGTVQITMTLTLDVANPDEERPLSDLILLTVHDDQP